jgi:hypothetical protein
MYDTPNPRIQSDLVHHRFALDESSSAFKYNIVAAALRQQSFFYQVSLPHYQLSPFLDEAISRYSSFLLLKKEYQTELLVPCFDVDLLWHTHQVHPENYFKDCSEILGRILPHDDSINDRSQGSTLEVAFTRTRQLWKKKFNEECPRAGAMYRGEQPKGKLSKLSEIEKMKVAGVTHSPYILERIRISKIDSQKRRNVKVYIWLEKFDEIQTCSRECIAIYDGKIGPNPINSSALGSIPPNPLLDLNLNFENRRIGIPFQSNLYVEVKKISRILKNERTVAKAALKCLLSSELGFQDQKGFLVSDGKSGRTQPIPMSVSFCLNPSGGYFLDDGKATLELHRVPLKEVVLPVDDESLWGPVVLKPLPSGSVNKCTVAKHW